MTREEAIKIAQPAWGAHAADAIDTYVMLGMLKLDEPKGPKERAVEALFAHPDFQGSGMVTPRHAIDAIDAAGLKIVEK